MKRCSQPKLLGEQGWQRRGYLNVLEVSPEVEGAVDILASPSQVPSSCWSLLPSSLQALLDTFWRDRKKGQ